MNLLIIASALLAATVTSKNLEEVYSDEKVVTAVSFDGLATTNDLTAATNGLVTASVTNGLASAAAISAHASATNNPHGVTAAQLGALTAEADPVFAAWTTNEIIVVGHDNNVEYVSPSIVIGSGNEAGCDGVNQQVIVIGNNNFANESEGGIFIGNGLSGVWLPDGTYTKHLSYFHVPWNPSRFVFCGAKLTLQSYLDERATTNDLADVKASIPVISATDATFSNAVDAAARALVKSKLESLDKAKSSIGETIATLQSIYETETK